MLRGGSPSRRLRAFSSKVNQSRVLLKSYQLYLFLNAPDMFQKFKRFWKRMITWRLD